MKEARAKVLFVRDDFVVLDRSIFYAESGGQAPDRGTIAGIYVADVQDQGGRLLFVDHPRVRVPAVKVDTVIVQRLATSALFRVGETVVLSLDWANRYRTMRHHSASHFLFHAASRIWFDGGPPQVKGCHIDAQGHRFDFAANLDGDRLAEVEALTNDLIAQGGDIVLELEPRSSEIRYWCYGSDIVIPCGGNQSAFATAPQPSTRVLADRRRDGMQRAPPSHLQWRFTVRSNSVSMCHRSFTGQSATIFDII